MCVSGEEEPGGTTAGGGEAIPEIVVTAPRIGLDADVVNLVDWDEVARAAGIGSVGGLIGSWGNFYASGAAGVTAAAAAIEGQEGVDLEDLVEIKDDMIYVRGGFTPYVPIY